MLGWMYERLCGFNRRGPVGKTSLPKRRLAYEALERREMMTASVTAGLTASLAANGVLTVTGTAAADTITVRQISNQLQVDGVSGSFAVSQVKQIVVNAGGGNDTVNLDSGAVSGQQPITIPAVLNGGAGVDTLIGGSGPNTYNVGGSEADQLPDYKAGDAVVFSSSLQVIKYAVTPGGSLYTLQAGGWLCEAGVATWSNIKDFALGKDGSLYLLGNSGQLSHLLLNGTWDTTTFAGGLVTKFQIDPANGSVWALDVNDNLSVNGQVQFANTRDFALAADGSLYWLGAGGLWHDTRGGGWHVVVAGAVTKFALAPDGVVYSLSAAGLLSVNGQPAWSNTQDFALGSDGSLYKLDTSGNLLHQELNGTWDASPVYSGFVSKFQIDPAGGSVWALGSNGWLSMNGAQYWAKTADFAFGGDGSLYRLDTTGNLYDMGINPASSSSFGARWAGAVVKIQINPVDGSVWALQGNGTLLVNGTQRRSGIKDFALDSDGSMYLLDSSGNLWWGTYGSVPAEYDAEESAFLGPNGMLDLNMPRATPSGLCLSQSDVDTLRSDPGDMAALFAKDKAAFRNELNSLGNNAFSGLTDEGLLAVFASVAAYQIMSAGLFTYGNGSGAALTAGDFLQAPGLTCSQYCELTVQLFHEAIPSLTTGIKFYEMGWRGNAVGDHAELEVTGAGVPLILDPTEGLVLSAQLGNLLSGQSSQTHYVQVGFQQPYRMPQLVATVNFRNRVLAAYRGSAFMTNSDIAGAGLPAGSTDFTYFRDLDTWTRTAGSDPLPARIVVLGDTLYVLDESTPPSFVGLTSWSHSAVLASGVEDFNIVQKGEVPQEFQVEQVGGKLWSFAAAADGNWTST